MKTACRRTIRLTAASFVTGILAVAGNAQPAAPAPAFERETLELKPCHHWRFEETGGASLADSAGGWTCAAKGGSLFKLDTPGPRPPAFTGFAENNRAATFLRANSGGAFIADSSAIDTLAPGNVFSQGTVTALTMSVWFQLSEAGALSGTRQVIAGFQQKGGARYSFLVCRETDAVLKVYAKAKNGHAQIVAQPYDAMWDTEWHHFVMAWDGAALRTYLDGGNEKTYTQAGMSGGLRASDGFYIGQDITNSAYFDGRIDEVALFSAALTAGQVASLYTAAGHDPRARKKTVVQPDAAEWGMPARGVCAHRGAMVSHPENTLAAFREAIRLGAHMIEFDVNFSKDGHLVLMHDATVDRTTDGKGRVVDLTFEQLRALDAGSHKGAAFAGERIPTFAEALAIMPMNIWLNVHIKANTHMGAAVAKEIVRQGRAHQAFIATGRKAATAARQVYPPILICNMERQGNSVAYVDDTIKHKDAFLQLLPKPAAPEDMARLKAAGVRINCFVGGGKPNKADELAALFNAGVEFPLVDDLAPMMEAARALGIEPLVPRYRADAASAK